MSTSQPKAIVLLSGGLDSTTILALAKSQGYATYAMSFRYGQRHQHELQAAAKVAKVLGADYHRVVDIDLAAFGGSALTANIDVPKGRDAHEMASGIPITYVPARNTVFLSYALAWCEVLECSNIFIGVNALDYSGYPDCRPEFVEAYEKMANLATRLGTEGTGIKIHAPLLYKTKAEIVDLGLTLGVDYALTISCYDPSPEGYACGDCDACSLRLKGFAANSRPDPAPYVSVRSV